MFFLYKYIDDIIGKGFEWYTILEIMVYQMAVNVPMALPLAVLLSSIMTFGSLGENYELVAIKSAGISLQRAMRPLFVVIILLSVSSFYFSDYMLPKVNAKYHSLLYDIRNKKLSFLIKPGVFNTSIPNYAIRVDRKGVVNPDSLYGIVIFDHNASNNIPVIIMAEKGRMIKTDDGNTMIIKLINGIRYVEQSSNNATVYNPRQTFTRMRFGETEVKLDFSSFTNFDRTDEGAFKSNAPMLNLAGLKKRVDTLYRIQDSMARDVKRFVGSYYKQYNTAKGYSRLNEKPVDIKADILQNFPLKDRMTIVNNAVDLTQSVAQAISFKITDAAEADKQIKISKIEYQRKFTIAVSCLLLFFIGAPLGAIIRKGGLGLPVVIAVIFFLVYHIISTVSEKSIKEGALDSSLGMWMAIIILTPLGIFLTYKATVDSAILDLESYKQLIVNYFKKFNFFKKKSKAE